MARGKSAIPAPVAPMSVLAERTFDLYAIPRGRLAGLQGTPSRCGTSNVCPWHRAIRSPFSRRESAFLTTECYCLAQAVLSQPVAPHTACAKQRHTVTDFARVVRNAG
jgi:hypothetical protein